MSRPEWIEDEIARSAVELFQHELNVLILDLLNDEADAGHAKLKAARDRALESIKNFELYAVAPREEVEIKDRAMDLLERSFGYMLTLAKAIGDDRAGG